MTDTVYALATSSMPRPPGKRLYFAARTSGLCRSEDGIHWDSLSASFDAPISTSVALPSVFMAESSAHVFAGMSGNVIRSTDAGGSWQSVSLGAPAPLVSALAVSPDYARDATLWASTLEDGVFRSEDGGEHWSSWPFGLFDLRVLCLALSPAYSADKTLFVGTETGVYRSSNGGRSWRPVAFPAESAPVLSLTLSPDFALDGVIFAGTEADDLLHSSDRGATWQCLGANAGMSPVNQSLLSPQYPAQPHLLVQGNGLLFLSRDAGRTWETLSGNWGKRQVTAVAAPDGIAPRATVLVGLDDGSIARITLAK